MPNVNTNDVTITFGITSIKTQLLSVNPTAKGAKIKTTGMGATKHRYKIGITDEELTLKFAGSMPTINKGDTGALAMTWPDGETIGSDTMLVCDDKAVSGSMDQGYEATLKFCPYDTTS